MKKTITVIAASLSFALIAGAAENPKMETFLGYNFVRFNPDSGFVPSFNANGASGQVVYNVYKWIGVVGDFGAVHKGTLNGSNVDTTVVNFVAGPRVSLPNHTRFTPYAEVMFGGAYATTSARISALGATSTFPGVVLNPNVPVSARVEASHTVFAMMAGGGLDIKLNKQIAFRPIGADYYLTRMPSLVPGQHVDKNNWRLSAGVSFMFGAQ